jgi:hypothetical protein
MRRLTLGCVGLLFAGVLGAQEVQRFSFDVGAGFVEPVNNTGPYLDTGWNLGAGAGMNFSQYVGAMIDLNYSHMGVNSFTLNRLGFPGGDVSVFSATLNPVIHLTPHGHFDLYATGGGGLYHQYQEFTAPSVGAVTLYNPFFGFYTAAVPTTSVLASDSVNKPGIDAGMGIAMGTKWHGKFFAEARFNRIFNNRGIHTDYLPVTLGFRW